MTTVHALHQGAVLCGVSRDVPGNWPEGHLWAPLRNIRSVTCLACIAAAATGPEWQEKPRFDEDDWQERESEQQQLVEGIISSLHHLTGDDGENYAKVFGGIAQLIIWYICDDVSDEKDNPIHAPTSIERIAALRLYTLEVDGPIRAFVGPDNEEERKFLLGVILEKTTVSIRTPSSNAYNIKLMYERRR